MQKRQNDTKGVFRMSNRGSIKKNIFKDFSNLFRSSFLPKQILTYFRKKVHFKVFDRSFNTPLSSIRATRGSYKSYLQANNQVSTDPDVFLKKSLWKISLENASVVIFFSVKLKAAVLKLYVNQILRTIFLVSLAKFFRALFS